MLTQIKIKKVSRPYNVSNAKLFLIMTVTSLARRKGAALTSLLSALVAAAVTLYMAGLETGAGERFAREFRAYGANLAVTGEITPEKYLKLVNLLSGYGDSFVGAASFSYTDAFSEGLEITLVKTRFEEALKTNPYWQLTGEKGAVLGSDIASVLGFEIGGKMPLNGAELTVTGLLKTGGLSDMYVYTELAEGENAELVEVSLALEERELTDLAAHISAETGLKAGKVARITDSESRVMGKLNIFLAAVALFTLLLTMISAGVATSGAVLARRTEIALKKALGAETWAVAREFLCETAFVGLLGSALGSLCGAALLYKTGEKLFGSAVSAPLYLYPAIGLAVVFLMTLAALIPIRRIVAIEPAMVLKGQ